MIFSSSSASSRETGDLLIAGHHNPAPAVLPLIDKVDCLALLQQLICFVPEMQMQDLALARKEIVLHINARHGRQVCPDNAHGDMVRQFRCRIVSGFDSLQSQAPPFPVFLGFLIELGYPRIHIPAVIVEFARYLLPDPGVSSSPSARVRPQHPQPERPCCRGSSELRLDGPGIAGSERTNRPGWHCANARYEPPCWD